VKSVGRLYDLNTPYGTKEELVDLLKALKEAGIKSVGDVVTPLPATPHPQQFL
jgi:glycosidase